MNQTALVTGANKGIGYETARQLAQQGYTVWVGARDRGRGEKAVDAQSSAGDVRFVSLDVTDEASISRAAAHIEAAPSAHSTPSHPPKVPSRRSLRSPTPPRRRS
ncbi:SDR family NAD(P)-dependent oxidoreductase [Herbiconiux sp. 11R-BC]|uniref:SDR family NAD(P)-dependent oxidoreductase n=1 Tax=Herbiconiux sp. 11R-BC TaxID=3111637 RepID=UPI003C02864F